MNLDNEGQPYFNEVQSMTLLHQLQHVTTQLELAVHETHVWRQIMAEQVSLTSDQVDWLDDLTMRREHVIYEAEQLLKAPWVVEMVGYFDSDSDGDPIA